MISAGWLESGRVHIGRRGRIGASAAAALTLALTLPLWAFPEPALAPRSWQLDFQHQAPRMIWVTSARGERWYMYMTYQVTNRTGQERLFVPEFTMATNQGDILPAGKGVAATVFASVKTRESNDLLVSPSQIVGQLLQGENNARESVAIWPVPKNDVDEISIFITGLTGETQVIAHPATGEDVVMAKSLMLDYDLPGSSNNFEGQPVQPRGKRWIMR